MTAVPAQVRYFDNNATTRVAPEVIEVMRPYFESEWGNPSSAYTFGHNVSKALTRAREQAAALVGAEPREIVFTSCGTESINTALNSAVLTQPKKRHVITTAVEHSASLKYCRFLKQQGFDVTFLPVDSDGALDLHLLQTSLRPDTAVVSIMLANNETGVMFPIEEIAAICQGHGVLCHTDAVQVPGKVAIRVRDLGVDYLSLSAHKFHAPKGIGMLYVRKQAPYHSYLIGGQQERGRRGGTENVPYIMALGRAAELAMSQITEENTRVRRLRDRMETEIIRRIPNVQRNGAGSDRLPNTSNLAFAGVEAEAVLLLLDQKGICASSGSACTTGSVEPSHVLLAMGLNAERARGCVRFSLGIYNTEEDVDVLLAELPPIIERLRKEIPAKPAAGNPAAAVPGAHA